MRRSNYQEVKNLVHNELGITKDDIKDILKQTVNDAVEGLMNSGEVEALISSIINERINKSYGRGLGSNFESNVRGIVAHEVGRWVSSKLDITVKQSEEPKRVNMIYHLDNKS